jgi:hypothetical protein
MSKRHRLWDRHARIDMVTYQSGDVKYEAIPARKGGKALQAFESITEAEAHLDAWWLLQERSRRRA